MNKKVMVIGSSNTDMVMQLDTLPTAGQTLLGDNFQVHPGGKGANQAVAAARLGAEVIFVAAVGADQFGQQAVHNFEQDQIDVSCIKTCPNHPSGVALIMVGGNGENMIGVASGANFQLLPEDIPTDKMSDMNCVLLQLETPIDTVMHAARHAKAQGIPVVLNPAPAQALSDELLSCVDILTPNETEAEALTGIPVTDQASAQQAAHALLAKGVKTVLITLGENGVLLSQQGSEAQCIPAEKVEAVDTTAAGDTFNGALCAGFAKGMPLLDAIHYANHAAAISVTKPGAQPAIPHEAMVTASTAKDPL